MASVTFDAGLGKVITIIGGIDPDAVMKDTWGHLAPKAKRDHAGRILFGVTAYGGQSHILINMDFPSLPDSPWLYEDVNDYLDSLLGDDTLEQGAVYVWTGVYRVQRRRGYGQFTGKCERVFSLAAEREADAVIAAAVQTLMDKEDA